MLEAIYARRAVRAYDPRDVDDATVNMLLRAAVQAPSAMNAQPWIFAVVQDRAQLKRYSQLAKRQLLAMESNDPKLDRYADLLRNESYDIFYGAGTLIVIGVKEQGPFSAADGWLAAENLMLAATEVGLGTCCIGFAMALLAQPQIKNELRIPEAGAAISAVIVGHPSVSPPGVPRGEPQIVFWSRPAP